MTALNIASRGIMPGVLSGSLRGKATGTLVWRFVSVDIFSDAEASEFGNGSVSVHGLLSMSQSEE